MGVIVSWVMTYFIQYMLIHKWEQVSKYIENQSLNKTQSSTLKWHLIIKCMNNALSTHPLPFLPSIHQFASEREDSAKKHEKHSRRRNINTDMNSNNTKYRKWKQYSFKTQLHVCVSRFLLLFTRKKSLSWMRESCTDNYFFVESEKIIKRSSIIECQVDVFMSSFWVILWNKKGVCLMEMSLWGFFLRGVDHELQKLLN